MELSGKFELMIECTCMHDVLPPALRLEVMDMCAPSLSSFSLFKERRMDVCTGVRRQRRRGEACAWECVYSGLGILCVLHMYGISIKGLRIDGGWEQDDERAGADRGGLGNGISMPGHHE